MSKLYFELVSNCVVDFNGRKNNKNTDNNRRAYGSSTVRNYEHKSQGEKMSYTCIIL